MNNIEKYSLKERFIIFSNYASLLVMLLGVLIIIGWIFNIEIFKSVLSGFPATKINTAIVFILCGAVLWNTNSKYQQLYFYLRYIAIFFILVIGTLTFIEYILNINFDINEIFIKDIQATSNAFPGRMSFASSLCTILMGFALIFVNQPREEIRNLSQFPVVIVISISFLALIGYLYNVQALYILVTYSTMGINTAIGFLLCSLSVLWGRPDEGWTKIIIAESAGGVVLRRLLLPIVVVPLLVGWLILLGVKANWYENHFGIAIISVIITGFVVVTLLINGEQLNHLDQNRKNVEERYRNVLDNLMEGAHIIGFDWRYLYVNETGAKHGRQEPKALIGKTLIDAYRDIEKLPLFHVLKNCMELRETGWMETEFFYPDGSSGWFEFTVQPVEEGIFILTIEITARKQAEKAFQKLNFDLEQRIEERTIELKTANEKLQNQLIFREQIETNLRQSETQYRALFEQSNDAVFILDLQGNHIIVNQHAADMLGYTADEIQRLSYADLSAETEKSTKVMKQLLSGEHVPVFERLFRKKNGEIFPVEINVELVRDDSGIPLHIQSVVRDITNRKQDEETTYRQNKMLSELHEITLDLLKQNSLEQLLKRIVEISSEFLDASYAGITLIEGEELVLKAVTQNRASILGQRLRRDDAKLTWQAFDSKKTMVLSNYDNWPDRRKENQGFPHYAVIDIPILNGDECLGVLALGRDKPNYEFSEEQIQFGSLFASITALIIINSQLRETLKQQSIHDALTGLFNRRYMEETLKQEISRAARQNHLLGIIMLDIDHFKKFNDSFGHQAGDSLLSQLGQFLQTNIRTEDTACRYGGEEFILILPNVSLETVKERAQVLREEFLHLKVHTNNTMVGTTISLGIGMYPQHGQTPESLIQSADSALYRAKQGGRNRVEVARN